VITLESPKSHTCHSSTSTSQLTWPYVVITVDAHGTIHSLNVINYFRTRQLLEFKTVLLDRFSRLTKVPYRMRRWQWQRLAHDNNLLSGHSIELSFEGNNWNNNLHYSPKTAGVNWRKSGLVIKKAKSNILHNFYTCGLFYIPLHRSISQRETERSRCLKARVRVRPG
jgi:hypothetical protein